MDRTVEAYLTIAAIHARHGTTALMPTTLTVATPDMIKAFEVYEEACLQNTSGATFAGIHLEGPYFAKEQAGAQDPRFIRNPDPEEYRAIVDACKSLRRWSAAPELEGALEFARYIRSRGIVPSIGHTNALAADVYPAFEAGFTMMTHLYSAMLGVTRRHAFRHAGAIEAAFLIDEMDVEIIADGIHLPPDLLKLICKVKGHDHIALVSDSMRAAGMPEGEYMLGDLAKGIRVIVEDGVAKMPDRTAFAGSVATADRLVRTMVQQAGIPLHDAVKMITANPARMANLSKKGALSAGMDADITVFDENIRICLTMVEGKVVFCS
jgi:N-acetylglucosamine-6-phosphate deacetylase